MSKRVLADDKGVIPVAAFEVITVKVPSSRLIKVGPGNCEAKRWKHDQAVSVSRSHIVTTTCCRNRSCGAISSRFAILSGLTRTRAPRFTFTPYGIVDLPARATDPHFRLVLDTNWEVVELPRWIHGFISPCEMMASAMPAGNLSTARSQMPVTAGKDLPSAPGKSSPQITRARWLPLAKRASWISHVVPSAKRRTRTLSNADESGACHHSELVPFPQHASLEPQRPQDLLAWALNPFTCPALVPWSFASIHSNE